MGFVLSLAKVNVFGGHQTLVDVETLAYYKEDDFSPRTVTFTVNVIKHLG